MLWLLRRESDSKKRLGLFEDCFQQAGTVRGRPGSSAVVRMPSAFLLAAAGTTCPASVFIRRHIHLHVHGEHSRGFYCLTTLLTSTVVSAASAAAPVFICGLLGSLALGPLRQGLTSAASASSAAALQGQMSAVLGQCKPPCPHDRFRHQEESGVASA